MDNLQKSKQLLCIKSLNYIFGCHPYSNLSFVSAVDLNKKVTYRNNRATFSYISGGIVPGILVINLNFPEKKKTGHFFWGEKDVTVGGVLIIFIAAAENLLTKRYSFSGR